MPTPPGPNDTQLKPPPGETMGGTPWNQALASGGRIGPSDAQKESAAEVSSDMSRFAASSGLAGMTAFGSTEITGPFGIGFGTFFVILALGGQAIAEHQDGIADDPPRMDYKDIAFFTKSLTFPKEVWQFVSRADLETAEDTYRLGSLTKGMLASIERAQGADIEKSEEWKKQQAIAAQYAWDLSQTIWKDLVPRTRNLCQKMDKRFADQKISEIDLKNAKGNLLAKIDHSTLIKMGMSKETITSSGNGWDIDSVRQQPGFDKMTVGELMNSVLDDVEKSTRRWLMVMG